MNRKNSLREIRMKKGLSISELARKVELTERHLRFIESGQRRPSLETAIKIAKVLECSIEKIF